MFKVLINGCNGKMGNIVANMIDSFDDLVLIGGFDRRNNGLSAFPIFTNFNDIKEKPDVVIDFSAPESTLNILNFCKEFNIPIVIATTGFDNEQLNLINEFATYIPIFKSANMSYDINLMKAIVAEVALKLQNSDIEIIETHHNRKADTPSGTAILLADSINSVLNNEKFYNFDRYNNSKRQKNEIGFSSIRGGNIVGEHCVKFFSENETFEIKHTSYSREIFAEGAIKAARFIIDKPCGLYNMDNLI